MCVNPSKLRSTSGKRSAQTIDVRRLIYADAAQLDLVAIALDVAARSGSRAAGDAFAAKLEARCEHLAALPGLLGTARPELRADLRSIVHNNYLIFFRYSGQAVEIVNILAGRRNLEFLFEGNDTEPH